MQIRYWPADKNEPYSGPMLPSPNEHESTPHGIRRTISKAQLRAIKKASEKKVKAENNKTPLNVNVIVK